MQTLPILGQGVYTPRRAAMLVRGTPQEVLRWTRGSGTTEPLWTAHYQFIEDSTELSFYDLIEVRVVKALRKAGASLQAIRSAIQLASNRFGVERPLLNSAFLTDGSEILMEALEGDGEFMSLSPRRPGQKVFSKIVSDSLKDLEYDGQEVSRWRPSAHSQIVIDPNRAFGDAILDRFAISTSIIHDEIDQGHSHKYLAKVYDIPETAVRAARAFETSLAA